MGGYERADPECRGYFRRDHFVQFLAHVLGEPARSLTDEEAAEIYIVIDPRNEDRAPLADVIEKDIVMLVKSYLGVKDARSCEDLWALLRLQESLAQMPDIQNDPQRVRDLWDDQRKRVKPFDYARRWNMWREKRIFHGTVRGREHGVKQVGAKVMNKLEDARKS